jgi:group I intron endonuclease
MKGIYKIINPQGKIYIGQSIDIERRFKEYQNLRACSDSRKLYYSLKKYTPTNHIFEILEECEEHLLEEKEIYYINLYNSIQEGLNIKNGSKPQWTGKNRPNHSKWLKENGSGLSYNREEKHLKLISKRSKEQWANKEWKKEVSRRIKEGKNNPNSKKYQKAVICETDGKIYPSLKKASNAYNISLGFLCNHINNPTKYPTAKGKIFKQYRRKIL